MKRLTKLAPWCSASVALAFAFATASFTQAHHPNKERQSVHPYYDLIGPIGKRLPPDHRRKYNRPSYLAGKIAYWIAPSSQEAMSWHRSVHTGAYSHPKKHLRLEQHYFYPKPYDVLRIGPRPSMLEPIEEIGSVSPLPQPIETLPLEPSLEPAESDVSLPNEGDGASSPSDAPWPPVVAAPVSRSQVSRTPGLISAQ